jgi:hypothetical protein
VTSTLANFGDIKSPALRSDSFNYAFLQAEVGNNLRLQASRIKNRIHKTTRDFIDIGRDLEAARQHLDRGQFGTWVEAEIGITVRSAQNYMTLARLADDEGETVSLLSPRIVQRLAARSTPPEIVKEVLAQMRSGDEFSDGVVAQFDQCPRD